MSLKSQSVQFRALHPLCVALLLVLILGGADHVKAAAFSNLELALEQYYVFQENDAFVTRCGQFNQPGDPDPCDASTQSLQPGGEQDLPALDDFLISEPAPILGLGNAVFSVETPVWLRIIDAGLPGVSYRPTYMGGLIQEEVDYFDLNGYTTLGGELSATSTLLERAAGDITASGGNACTNIAECWADPSFYVAEMFLQPGSYAVRLQLDLENPGPNDFAYVGVFEDSILSLEPSAVVPEPGTSLLIGLGAAAIFAGSRWRKR